MSTILYIDALIKIFEKDKHNLLWTNEAKEDMCSICLDATSNSRQSIKLECSHLFHEDCVISIYQINTYDFEQNGKHISFSHFMCPLCKQSMKHSKLRQFNIELKILKKRIAEIGEMRLKYDKLLNDNENLEKSKLLELIMQKYTFYLCNKCNKPYYGGKMECIVNDVDYHTEVKLCPKCCSIKHNDAFCSKHGDEYILWKCRFCCNIGIYFCWGNSHFCAGCHINRDALVQLYKTNKLLQCPAAAPKLINNASQNFKHRYLPKKKISEVRRVG
eukprot:440128_1